MLDQEEYDDISVAESLISETQRDSEQTVQVFSLSFLSFISDSREFLFLNYSCQLSYVRMFNDESSSSLSIATTLLFSTGCLLV